MRFYYRKIIAGILFILIINLVISSIFIFQYTRKDFEDKVIDSLLANAKMVSELVWAKGLSNISSTETAERFNEISRTLGIRITIIDTNGKVILDSFYTAAKMENHLMRPEIQEAMHSKIGIDKRISPTLNIPMTYLAIPYWEDGKVSAVIRVSEPQQNISSRLYSALSKSLLYGVGIGAIVVAIISFIVAGWYSKPIEMMKDAAKNISEGNFDYKIKIKGKDELSDLAAHINEMSLKLSRYFDELNEEAERINAILTSMNEELLLVGANGILYLANNAFCQLFNMPKEQIENRNYLKAISEESVLKFIKKALKEQKYDVSEITLKTNSISQKHYILSASPISLTNGMFRGIVIIFHDTTLIKEMEKMRRQFVDNASHELKTPLSAIIAYLETLIDKEPQDASMREKFYKSALDSSVRLHNLINDLLDLSEIEHKKASLELIPVNISSLVREIVNDFLPSAKSKNHELCFMSTDEAWEAKIDKKTFVKALGNIIDNAIRYTEQGGKISVSLKKNLLGINIAVSDNGIGIPPQDIERIFERFYRVDKTRSIKSGGTGLGLSIAKHIVEAHGGKIKVASIPKNGTTFTITLPC